jgi:hypothetical protein
LNKRPASFIAPLEIIGVNPFVFVPEKILMSIFQQAGKERGPIPIAGTINGTPYRQTLVKFRGAWRLYVNTTMLKDSPKRIGEKVKMTIAHDAVSRAIEPPKAFLDALQENRQAKLIFDGLPMSGRQEIVRYLSRLKTEESLAKNIRRAVLFLLGKERFVGRSKP